MADSGAIDWVATTPPRFNPYSDPIYIPGGWPASPPSPPHWAGQKRKRSEDEDVEIRQTTPVFKRACTKFIASKDSAVATSHGIAKAAYLAVATTYRVGIGAWEIVQIVRRRQKRPRLAAAEKKFASQNNSAFARMKRMSSIRKQTTKSYLIALAEERASLHKRLNPETVQQYANVDGTKMHSANYIRARNAFAQASTKPRRFPLTPEPDAMEEDVPRRPDPVPVSDYPKYMPVPRPIPQYAPPAPKVPERTLLFIPRPVTPAPEMDGVEYTQAESSSRALRYEEDQKNFEPDVMDHDSTDGEESVHYATDMDHDSDEDTGIKENAHYAIQMDEDPVVGMRVRGVASYAKDMDHDFIEAVRAAAPTLYATDMEHDSNEDTEHKVINHTQERNIPQPAEMEIDVEPTPTRQHVISELETHSARNSVVMQNHAIKTPSDTSETTYPDDSPSRQLEAELMAALLESGESDMSSEDEDEDSQSELGNTTEEEIFASDTEDKPDLSGSDAENQLTEVVENDDADAEEADIETIQDTDIDTSSNTALKNEPAWVKPTVQFAPEVTVISTESELKIADIQTEQCIQSPKYEPYPSTHVPSTTMAVATGAESVSIDKQVDIAEATDVTKTPIKSQQIPGYDVINITDSNTNLAPIAGIAALSINESPNKLATPKTPLHHEEATRRRTRRQVAQEQAALESLNEYEIVPLSEEWDQKVRHAVKHGHGNYQASDFARVVPQYASRGQDNWLNDETINGYLDIVAKHGKKNDRPTQTPSHHALSTFFYPKLKDAGPEGIARWTKRAKIGGKSLLDVEKVYVPINQGMHWTVAVVSPMQRDIAHYNSLQSASRGVEVCRNLMNWVKFELGSAYNEDEWSVMANEESPQQNNSDDCGLFSITSSRQIMLGFTPMSFSSSQVQVQRKRVVAEILAGRLLKSKEE